MSQWNYPPYPVGNENLVSDDFMALLRNLSKDELNELMNNEDKINELVCDQEKVKKIKLEIELVQAENRSLADDTIEKEPVLDELRNVLTEKYNNLQQIKEMFLVNQAKHESLQQNVNLEALLNVLQAKCAMSEEKSEEIAEKFYNGDISLSEFVEQFKERKTEAHLRRIKADKMRELVIESQRHSRAATSPSINRQVYPPPGAYNMPQYPPHLLNNNKWK